MQAVTAGSVSVSNNGPDSGSDIDLGAVTSSGAQTYSDPNGTTNVTANLTATDDPISFTDSVVVKDGVIVDAGASTINFAGSGRKRCKVATAPVSSMSTTAAGVRCN